MEPAEYELMCETEDDELKAIGYKRGLLRAAEMAEDAAMGNPDGAALKNFAARLRAEAEGKE